MHIYFPQNIFADLIKNSLSEKLSSMVKFLPAPLITNEILKDSNSIGLIPTLDLIRHKDFFVSGSFGISFEESLCNSYLYYNSERRNLDELSIIGDISSNEVIGAKLIFKELYNTEIKLKLLTASTNIEGNNIICVGDINFEGDKYLKGVSFAEEIIEVLSLPYVNFVLAAVNQKPIENFNKSIDDIQGKVYNLVEGGNYGRNLSEDSKQIFRQNIASFICNLDDQDIDGINQLLRLPYFHEIISDIVEVKYI
jgi:hypothetical protein